MGPWQRIIWVVLDSVGIGELPDARDTATSDATLWDTSRIAAAGDSELGATLVCGTSPR